MGSELPERIWSLRVADRIRLVQDICESIATDSSALLVTDDEREELDRRLAAHAADPDAVAQWETVRAEIERTPGA